MELKLLCLFNPCSWVHSQHCAPYKGCANVQCECNINKNNIYVHDNDNVCT